MADVPRSGEVGPVHGGHPFLEVYKRGQGYYTRVGTAIGGGVLILAGGHFTWQNLAFDESTAAGLWLRVGIPLAVVVALSLLLYWAVGQNRRSCDFMIATEGEMKKVNWSSRREIITATKVVIVVTLLVAFSLFVVDWAFMKFFTWLNVLRAGHAIGGGT